MNLRHWAAVAMLAVSVAASAGDPVEILAMGDSLTNGHGLPASQAYPAQLEGLLRAEGYQVSVINAGIDGDNSVHIYDRMTKAVGPRTRLVIFQQSGNDLNPANGAEYTEKALAWLKDRRIPTVLISNKRVQPIDDARALANKYGAEYYGTFRKGIPNDSGHVQPGEYYANKNKVDYHLTAAGCAVVAKNLEPIVVKLLADNPLVETKSPSQ